MSRGRSTAVAALLYLIAALACYAPVLADPSGTLPVNAGLQPAIDRLSRWDQSVAVASTARNAHALLTEPWNLFDGFQCHPLPRSYTLGEHMFGSGVIAAVPYLLSWDPIFSYNGLLVLSAWIGALAMYFLTRELVDDAPAAFVAGLLFGMSSARIAGVAHPFAHADVFTPLALLFLARLLARGGLGNALAVALFVALEVMQSLYPLLWTAVILGCFAIWLAVVHRRHLVARLPLLALGLAILAVVTWLVLAPYLETRVTWGLLGDRMSLPFDVRGHFSWAPLFVLGALGILDRLRGRRPVLGGDPRWCLTIAGVLLLWLAAGPVVIGGVNFSLRRMLGAVVPGLDAVRGLYTMVYGTDLVLAVLAAYGVHALTERLPGRARLAVVALLAAWIGVAQHSPLTAWAAAPPDEDVALLRRTDGPVVELPYPAKGALIALANADLLRSTSYGPHRSSACYASFATPLEEPMRALLDRLPDAGAIDAVHALGFDALLLRRDRYFPGALARLESTLDGAPELHDRVRLVGRTEKIAVYELTGDVAASSDLAALVPDAGATPAALAIAAGTRAKVDFAVANAGATTFRHPDPIAPSDLVLRWTTAAGAPAGAHPARGLLPLALAPGMALPVVVDGEAPAAPGEYLATIALASRTEQVLGRRAVRVDAAAASTAPSPAPAVPAATP
jgi:hypothetical protein